MSIYKPSAGTSIDYAVREAIALSVGKEEPVEFIFNDVKLCVNEESDPAEIESIFHASMKMNSQAFNTPIRRQKEAERRRKMQADLDEFLPTLDSLDMTNKAEVLHWLCRFEELSGWTFVSYNRSHVLLKFVEAGYKPGEFCRKENETQEEWQEHAGAYGEFRWIVGQALEGISSMGCPHQMIHTFTERFMGKAT